MSTEEKPVQVRLQKVYEGRVQIHDETGIEWWSLEDDDEAGNCSSDASWLGGLEDRRVRITVEILS
jgi:hypothetical protein